MGRFSQIVENHRNKVDQAAADAEAAKIAAARAEQSARLRFQLFQSEEVLPLLKECADDLLAKGYSAKAETNDHSGAAVLTFNVKRESALGVNASDNSEFSVFMPSNSTDARCISYADQRQGPGSYKTLSLGNPPYSIEPVEKAVRDFLDAAFARNDAD